MSTLEGRHVFLSASFPSGPRGKEVEPFDAAAIADAVTAIVRAVLLSEGKILFGGHPTITPLVLLIGTELRTRRVVDIFQSDWYADQVTSESIRLVESGVADIHPTPKLDTREESELEMRSQMFDFVRPAGAVFVGGMSGIWDEHALFGDRHPGVPRLPLAGPGGAAARLEPDKEGVSQRIRAELASRHYPFLASLIVEALSDTELNGSHREAHVDPEAASLTHRERQILQLLATGLSTTAELADRLYISQKTLENHLDSIYRKLAVSDRTQAVREAVRLGIARPT
jgi:DNA-binding CsgD family transcriptional regulator